MGWAYPGAYKKKRIGWYYIARQVVSAGEGGVTDVFEEMLKESFMNVLYEVDR